MFSALLEYALVNYASRSDAQRLAKLKSKKQLELDHCAFDPEHMMMNDDLPPGHGPPPPPMGPPPMGPPGMPPPLLPPVPPSRQGLNGGGGSFSMVSEFVPSVQIQWYVRFRHQHESHRFVRRDSNKSFSQVW